VCQCPGSISSLYSGVSTVLPPWWCLRPNLELSVELMQNLPEFCDASQSVYRHPQKNINPRGPKVSSQTRSPIRILWCIWKCLQPSPKKHKPKGQKVSSQTRSRIRSAITFASNVQIQSNLLVNLHSFF